MAREPSRDDEIRAATIGEPHVIDGTIELVEYDDAWPLLYQREAARIRSVLGDRIIALEHVGSTAVPGLLAKPRIDVVLVVADSADEDAYIPPLEEAGYVLRIREPDWYEHRALKGPDTDINLHVFSPDCVEVERMLLFRDHLRGHESERELYAATKRELAARTWKYVQNYADAKSALVEAILERASARRLSPRD